MICMLAIAYNSLENFDITTKFTWGVTYHILTILVKKIRNEKKNVEDYKNHVHVLPTRHGILFMLLLHTKWVTWWIHFTMVYTIVKRINKYVIECGAIRYTLGKIAVFPLLEQNKPSAACLNSLFHNVFTEPGGLPYILKLPTNKRLVSELIITTCSWWIRSETPYEAYGRSLFWFGDWWEMVGGTKSSKYCILNFLFT